MSRLRHYLVGGPRPAWLRYVLLIAAATGIMRVSLDTQWLRESAILYILIPYLIGVLLYVATPRTEGVGFWARLWRHMRTALIVMLSSSLLLFEGFLCVIMFLPIYLVFAMLVIGTDPKRSGDRDWRNGTKATLVPVLVLFLSLDGVRGTNISLGPDRMTTVTRTAIVDLTPQELRENITDHAYPDAGRSGFLSLFPRPVAVEAESVSVGAHHIAHMEYRRWGLPHLNVHRGTIIMVFSESTDTRLRARFVHDDSYLSHYMQFRDWTLDMEPHDNGRTKVTLSVGYERLLAPAWYFGPLQKRAVGDGLEYALAEIIAANPKPEMATLLPKSLVE